jgi:immune inhibitor A
MESRIFPMPFRLKSRQKMHFWSWLAVGLSVWLLSTQWSVFAQEDESSYPTVTALEEAVLPARDRVLLAQQLLGVGPIDPPPTEPFAVGDRKMFKALNTSANRIFEFEAELFARGDSVYIWVDSRAEVEREQAQALADAFDSTIYPEVRDLWGSEEIPGIDGDPRVYALFTYDLGGGIAAYYSSENTFPSEVSASSNEHEMFIYELGAIGTDIDSWLSESVTAHEFQHMIRDRVTPNMDSWLNEGLSVFTQVYLDYPDGEWSAMAYQDSPDTQLNHWSEGDTGPNYGGSLLFVTYFYERYGLKPLQTVSRLNISAMDAFNEVLVDMGAEDVNDLFADWVLANYWRDTDLVSDDTNASYGYDLIDGLTEPVVEELEVEPEVIEEEANQYSAHYFEYDEDDLEGIKALDVAFSAPETVRVIPTDAASGERFWYSNRRDNSATTLTKEIDLTGATEATLEYDLWFYTEQLWDYGYVMVSTDQGESWSLLNTATMTDANPHGTAYGSGYTGQSDGWIRESISLDEYAGQTIWVRFSMITDDATNQYGLAIDNLTITADGEVIESSGFEADNGGWQGEGWVWIDNVLPQSAWVQVTQRSGDILEVTRWRYPEEQPDSVEIIDNAEQVMVVVSPFALQTTVPTEYTLSITPVE